MKGILMGFKKDKSYGDMVFLLTEWPTKLLME
jgi:hypothetical protein